MSDDHHMNDVRSTFWPRLATGLLILYWVGLLIGTHAPRLPVNMPGGSDKVAHFSAFVGLAFLLSWAWTTRRPFLPTGAIFAVGVGVLYGTLDELTQRIVPGRSCELADLLADAMGALAGTLLFCGLDLAYRHMRQLASPAQRKP